MDCSKLLLPNISIHKKKLVYASRIRNNRLKNQSDLANMTVSILHTFCRPFLLDAFNIRGVPGKEAKSRLGDTNQHFLRLSIVFKAH